MSNVWEKVYQPKKKKKSWERESERKKKYYYFLSFLYMEEAESD